MSSALKPRARARIDIDIFTSLERQGKKYAEKKSKSSKPQHAADDDELILRFTLPEVRLQIPSFVVPLETRSKKEEIATLDDVLHFVRVCVLFDGGFAPDGGDFCPSRGRNILAAR